MVRAELRGPSRASCAAARSNIGNNNGVNFDLNQTKRYTITADRLFLAADPIGTSELLVRSRALGHLPMLNEHIGAGWGEPAALRAGAARSRGGA